MGFDGSVHISADYADNFLQKPGPYSVAVCRQTVETVGLAELGHASAPRPASGWSFRSSALAAGCVLLSLVSLSLAVSFARHVRRTSSLLEHQQKLLDIGHEP